MRFWLGLNPAWLAQPQRAAGAIQRRCGRAVCAAVGSTLASILFKNLTTWGLGLPLGILAWVGFTGWDGAILKGEWRHLLLWGWTAFYFGWQSLAFNPTMRYQLPIYPLLCMMAAWLIFDLWDRRGRKVYGGRSPSPRCAGRWCSTTLAWAYAFTRIYTRPLTRVAATHWIYQNLPGAINLHIQTGDGTGAYFNSPCHSLWYQISGRGSLSTVVRPESKRITP